MVRLQRDEGKSQYTQTYSTPARTVANPTASAPTLTAATVGDQGATQNTGWGADTEAHFDEIRTELNTNTADGVALKAEIDKLIADNLDLRKAVTALIDDLQEAGIIK